MSLGEFELIDRYFKRPVTQAVMGIGDDCALLALTPGMQLATSTDMLVEGRHFLSTVAADRLGHKTLAVNLSDLAACGARPFACTLALAMPRADPEFLAPFARGLLALADLHGCELVGGDTTQGPLALCVTVFGEVPAGQALLRSGAKPGDTIWVSGTIGDARLALEVFRGAVQLAGEDFERVRVAMEMPQPRVALGQALRGIASSAIDISDGLLGDLGHILRRSQVGATIDADAVPRSDVMRVQAPALQRQCILGGGDDYELLFTAAADLAGRVEAAGRLAGVVVTPIGRIEQCEGLRLIDRNGATLDEHHDSFDHFRS